MEKLSNFKRIYNDDEIVSTDGYETLSNKTFINGTIINSSITSSSMSNSTLNGCVLSLNDGSLSNPSLRFKNDIDTGIYLHTSNGFSMVGNGTDLFQLTPNMSFCKTGFRTGRNRRYTKTADMDLTSDGTKYVVHAGMNRFDTIDGSFFILDKPLYVEDLGVVVFISSDIPIIYLGSGPMVDQTFTNGTIVRFSDIIFLGAIPGNPIIRTCFNMISTGSSRAVCLFEFCQLLFFSNVGTLDGFDFIVATNFSMRYCLAGLTFKDTLSLVSAFVMDLSNGLSNGMTYFTISGTSSPTIQFAGINFIPSAGTGEYFVKISNTLTAPSALISNCIHNKTLNSNDNLFFNTSGGLDKTSIYVNAVGNKNIPNSVITGELTGNLPAGLTNTLNYINGWVFITPPTGYSIQNNERLTLHTSYPFIKVNSLESPVFLYNDLIISLESTSSSHDYDIQMIKIYESISCTVDNTTDTITSTSHGLSSGNFVILTGGSLPGGVFSNQIYWINVSGVNTFTLSSTATPYTLVNITSNGSSVKYFIVEFIGGIGEIEANSSKFLSVSTGSLKSFMNGNYISAAIRCNTDVNNPVISSYYLRIKN